MRRHAIARHTDPLGGILGIPIGLDCSWLVIVALLTWMLSGRVDPGAFHDWSPPVPWIMAAVTVGMLSAGGLRHEPGWGWVPIVFDRIAGSSAAEFLSKAQDRSLSLEHVEKYDAEAREVAGGRVSVMQGVTLCTSFPRATRQYT